MAHEVVLITGGSSGIGKSIGVYLKSKGFKVYGTTRNKLKYPDFNEFNLLEVDVRNSETISAAISKLIALEGRIDVLVNNAGVGITGPNANSKKWTCYKYNIYCWFYGITV